MTSRLLLAPLLLALVVLVVGLWLLSIAIRARRIGNAPHCRRCGFDLSGTIPDQWTPSQNHRCPECGTVLAHARTVTAGLRRRRPIVLILGLILALPVPIYLVLVIVSSVNWSALKPTGMLIRQAGSGSYWDATPAAQELLLRCNNGRLTNAQLSQAFDACLSQQSKSPLVWSDDAWSSLLAAAYDANAVSAQQQDLHIRQLFSTFYRTQQSLRDTYLLGEPFPFGEDAIVMHPDPLYNPYWSASGRVLGMAAYLQHATLDGEPLELRPSPTGSIGDIPKRGSIGWWTQHGHPRGSGSTPAAFPEDCNEIVTLTPPPGSHELSMSWRIDVFVLRPGEAEFEHPFREPDASWTTEMTHGFVVLSSPEDRLEYVRPGSVPAVEPPSFLGPADGLVLVVESARKLHRDGDWYYQVSAHVSRAPARIAADYSLLARASLRVGDAIYGPAEHPDFEGLVYDPPGHTGLSRGGGQSESSIHFGIIDLPRAAKADIILTPAPDLVFKDPDRYPIQRFWADEIVIKDVPIDWSRVDAPQSGQDPPPSSD